MYERVYVIRKRGKKNICRPFPGGRSICWVRRPSSKRGVNTERGVALRIGTRDILRALDTYRMRIHIYIRSVRVVYISRRINRIVNACLTGASADRHVSNANMRVLTISDVFAVSASPSSASSSSLIIIVFFFLVFLALSVARNSSNYSTMMLNAYMQYTHLINKPPREYRLS